MSNAITAGVERFYVLFYVKNKKDIEITYIYLQVSSNWNYREMSTIWFWNRDTQLTDIITCTIRILILKFFTRETWSKI